METITSLSGMLSGSIKASNGNVPAVEEVHGRLEPFVVVVVGPDDLELEDDHAVLVDPGRFEAGPDDHERARVVELSEPCLGGAGVARAFEHHRVGLGDRKGHGRLLQHVGRHDPGGPDVEGLLAPDGGRLAHGDVGDPLGTQHGDEQEADRAGPGDKHPIVRGDVGQPQRVQGDGHRLGQRGHPGRERIGNPDQAVGRHRLVLAEGTAVPDEVGRGAVQAHRRAAPSTGPADAAPRSRVPHHPVAGRPARATGRGGHDARPFVAENGTRFGVPLQDHVQIGAADAALGNLDEHLVGSRLRTGHLLDGDPAVAHIDGCRHQW